MAKLEIKGKDLVITIPISEKESKSGKSINIATTNGNKTTDLKYKGKTVVLGLNAYYAKD